MKATHDAIFFIVIIVLFLLAPPVHAAAVSESSVSFGVALIAWILVLLALVGVVFAVDLFMFALTGRSPISRIEEWLL